MVRPISSASMKTAGPIDKIAWLCNDGVYMMQRIQMIIDDQTRLQIVSWAREEGRSFSSVTREWLAEKLEEKKKIKKTSKKISAVESMQMMVKAAKKLAKYDNGPSDLSQNYDKYIY